ncbi:PREDICTED: zinc finger BED domain-containing protein RICESLEEPER 2-like [Erythranthe guttata]|uniref:zinc finger BED domain-containing protein RICESLEEPER 2-like n=1 Tax=Erythranthe guttata TaxID=4155 RepID=UPI00064D812B|nr:PREDICTED: zinc finger BED domain-containing protein RICESLEEPER 2-like [Erythranthe guttata]|eukprot:XP_012853660.1 PREDICTED: zinc finger BED domain-containing protein RICESLEEPER 2-like [Erythranthe guttata]
MVLKIQYRYRTVRQWYGTDTVPNVVVTDSSVFIRCRNLLATLSNLVKRNILESRSWELCGEGDEDVLRCISLCSFTRAHILNLVVHSGLKVINESIGKIRDNVKYVRGSETRTLKFVECVKQLGLKTSKKVVQDMLVRWNSTYMMLESALLYKLAFQQLKLVDINYKWCPLYEEWERVEKIAKFLRPFFEKTELFCGQHYPTANHYFPNVWRIQRLIHDEMTSGDSIVSAMARSMKPKFDKYWECYSTLLSFAIILDPRYKLPFVEFAYGKLDQLTVASKIEDLKEQMHDLFEDYLFASPLTSTQSSHTVGVGVDTEMSLMLSKVNEILLAVSQSQLEKYLNQPLLDRKQFPNLDLLDYWKGNATTYPEVA